VGIVHVTSVFNSDMNTVLLLQAKEGCDVINFMNMDAKPLPSLKKVSNY
jgi:hypothetical protein